MAQKATLDFKKALPSDEMEKGLELFSIVDQSMKKQKRKKKQAASGKITKRTSKTDKHRVKNLKKQRGAVNRRLKM